MPRLLRYWPLQPLVCDCGSIDVILDEQTHDYVCTSCGLVHSRAFYAEKRMEFHTEPLSEVAQEFISDTRLARFYNRSDEHVRLGRSVSKRRK